jgi:hypothetical protein
MHSYCKLVADFLLAKNMLSFLINGYSTGIITALTVYSTPVEQGCNWTEVEALSRVYRHRQ